MSARDYLDQAGLPSGVWIDGVGPYVGPRTWGIPQTLRQAPFTAMNMTVTVTGAYDGPGLPNVLDHFPFEFPWELDDNFRPLITALRLLATAGGVHTLAILRVDPYTYTLRAGQATFWMRGDAAAQDLSGFPPLPVSAASIEIPLSAVPNPTTVYQDSVSPSDSVPADEVWVSRQVTKHPTSGKFLAFCKLGTAPSVVATMTTVHFQLFRVVVTAIPRVDQSPAKEVATLMCAETN